MTLQQSGVQTTTSTETFPHDVIEVVEKIFQKFEQLDALRRYLFVEWLITHCHFVHGENIYHKLANWLSEMTAEDAKLQQDIISLEADWWANQTEETVQRLMTEHLSGRRRV